MVAFALSLLGSFLGTFAALVAHQKYTAWRMARIKKQFEESFLVELRKLDFGNERALQRSSGREMN